MEEHLLLPRLLAGLADRHRRRLAGATAIEKCSMDLPS
jgi:hypothetical protein